MLVPHCDLIVEGTRPMEGAARVDPTGVVENQHMEDPPPMKFTWKNRKLR
ncbi:hypothetical protein BT93_L2532 [Corymbia citriodora subsp. variegata]|uniref:Uncharacterized protein n=1 Tax=Corymbia citriodora subsp. variegata TaxID=360336 RepID=A0A8T0CJF9_CORYI|nr:hypothetical protein BT93_L2532 [Corymbia citriodora subsp. variegata]